jgi:hypothetical protein
MKPLNRLASLLLMLAPLMASAAELPDARVQRVLGASGVKHGPSQYLNGSPVDKCVGLSAFERTGARAGARIMAEANRE